MTYSRGSFMWSFWPNCIQCAWVAQSVQDFSLLRFLGCSVRTFALEIPAKNQKRWQEERVQTPAQVRRPIAASQALLPSILLSEVQEDYL